MATGGMMSDKNCARGSCYILEPHCMGKTPILVLYTCVAGMVRRLQCGTESIHCGVRYSTKPSYGWWVSWSTYVIKYPYIRCRGDPIIFEPPVWGRHQHSSRELFVWFVNTNAELKTFVVVYVILESPQDPYGQWVKPSLELHHWQYH